MEARRCFQLLAAVIGALGRGAAFVFVARPVIRCENACLARNEEPAALGLRSENAAHRIAVEWDADGCSQEGVYIPRRDSDSRFNTWVGGRVFPGQHQHAAFTIAESDDRFDVALRS